MRLTEADVERCLIRWSHVSVRCQGLLSEVAIWQEQIAELDGMTGRAMDGMPHGHGQTSDPTARAAAELDGIRDTYTAAIARIRRQIESEQRFRRDWDARLTHLSDAENKAVRARYKAGRVLTWDDAASVCGCSRWTVKRTVDRAIKKLANA